MSASVCRACNASTVPLIDLGRMPLADSFREPESNEPEFFYQLSIGRCPACGMAQIEAPVARERMFNQGYPFFTQSSRAMAAHFDRLGQDLLARLEPGTGEARFVVEIGGNDGTLLAPLVARGVRVLNVEPSANVAAVAAQRGVPTMVAFFDAAAAGRIVERSGCADAIVAANVVCHVENLVELFESVRTLLAPNGLFLFEDPHLGAILERNAVDQFYDEHVCYLTLRAVLGLARRTGLDVIDVALQPTHGGSMRYLLARAGARPAAASVAALLAREIEAGLFDEHVYRRFRSAVDRLRRKLPETLASLRRDGLRVAGFGATAKSATILNLCRIGPDLLPCIYDSTPLKQGRLTPGMHIPVRPVEAFRDDPPDCALLLAWNHEAEIRAANAGYERAGGRWLGYIPEVRILQGPAS